MSEIILDIGSGKSLHDVEGAKRMIDRVAELDSHRHDIIFKAQLFKEAPPNVPLDPNVYRVLYGYARHKGYWLTSSVFDECSLNIVLERHVPFVKIACRPDLYWLAGKVPRDVPVYESWDGSALPQYATVVFRCVRKYPARVEEYYPTEDTHWEAVSDHTIGLDLWRKYSPHYWEKHLVPEHDPYNLDAGPFSCTPDELKEVIG